MTWTFLYNLEILYNLKIHLKQEAHKKRLLSFIFKHFRNEQNRCIYWLKYLFISV